MNPYFFNISGIASLAPTSADTEATSLQKINALLFNIAAGGGSSGGGSSTTPQTLLTSQAAVQAVPTIGTTTPSYILAYINGVLETFVLIAGAGGDFLPNDYNASTNNKSYVQTQ